MAKLIQLPGAAPADEGETLVISYLREHLPGTYSLIPNAQIAQKGQPPFDYDVIVVAPHAVYVVEIKRWRGGISGDDYTWLVDGRHRRPNPLPTANNKARVLKSQIGRKQPALAHKVWVEAVIAIADDQGHLNLRGNSRNRVFCHPDLPDFLTDKTALGDKAGDLKSSRDAIEKAIEEAARGRPLGKLRFGDYEVEETIARRDRVAEYIARNTLLRAGEPVRLRVFSYDPYLPPDELAHRQEVIRREAETLQAVGNHANLISMRTYFTDPNDPNLFVEVTEWSDTGTLRAMMDPEAPLSLQKRLELAQGIAAGLKAVHDAKDNPDEKVVHRDIRPENILIGRDGQPRLMNFDHARLVVDGGQTVGPVSHDPDVPRAYMAPELLNPTNRPTPAADIYGLGLILFEMMVGVLPIEAPEDVVRANTLAGGPVEYGAADVPPRLNDLIRHMTKANPDERIQTADEVLAELQAIRDRPSGTEAPPVSEPAAPAPVNEPALPIEPERFEVQHIIDGKYEVLKVMEAGGSGRVYKVYDSLFDKVYALKVFKDSSISLDHITQEARSLIAASQRVPSLVQVYTWGQLRQSERLYLVTDFIEGEELTKYTTPSRRLPIREAVQAIIDLLEALEALHPDVDRIAALRAKMEEDEITGEEYAELGERQNTGWLHRDIKPANLMLAKDGLKLIDFNIATHIRTAGQTYTGTQGYMPPDIGLISWDTSCDLFATGIVLYELVTGHHPYPDRQPNMEDAPTDPRTYVEELAPAFAHLLLRAVSVDRTARYHSARSFRNDLLALGDVYLQATGITQSAIPLKLEAWEQGKPNYNPYVTRLLTLYSQARRDNSGTRGLGEIAQYTYVDTLLDRHLRPAVLNGQYRLIIITGNAGDGKTAFIKKLEEVVRNEGGLIDQTTSNSSTFVYNGVRFYTNYDGSQDEGAERANDQVLTEFFAGFDDAQFSQPPAVHTVHLIAINEGRLIDFFGAPQRQGAFSKLDRTISQFFDPEVRENVLPEWMLIIDLNQRSVVAPDPDTQTESIFERQLVALLKPEFWAPCESCTLKQRCFIKYNADTLADSISGPPVRERLRTLFEIIHLRRQLHITMRDMRSALSWLIFRDHTCDDMAAALVAYDQGKQDAASLLRLLYHNAYAADGEPPAERGDDRLVVLLRQIDPAEVANPTADRLLYFQGAAGLQMLTFDHRQSLVTDWMEQWELPTGWHITQQDALVSHQTRHAMMRRMAFFERRDDGWMHMLPYQNLERFRRMTQEAGANHNELKHLLVEGISLAEGARNAYLSKNFICLRAGTSNGAKIKSFRLFPIEDFQVQIPSIRTSAYLEYTPDQIMFYHEPRDANERVTGARRAELIVSLDLLELLVQIRDGFTPSPDDISGFFINLVIFKNALAHLPYRKVLLTRDNKQFYELTQDDTAIITLRKREGMTNEAQP